MFREVGAKPCDEVVATDECDELLQDRSSLGIGDPIEVGVDRLDVDHIRDDRMGRCHLVLPIGPVLSLRVEARPTVLESSAFNEREIRGELCEGFVEPKVIPP